MMTAEGYKDWCRFHKCLLIINDAEYDAYLAEIEHLFRKIGATVEELDNASVWLIDDPDRAKMAWRSHYGLLKQNIFMQRAARARAKERTERLKVELEFKGREPVSFAKLLADNLATKLPTRVESREE